MRDDNVTGAAKLPDDLLAEIMEGALTLMTSLREKAEKAGFKAEFAEVMADSRSRGAVLLRCGIAAAVENPRYREWLWLRAESLRAQGAGEDQ